EIFVPKQYANVLWESLLALGVAPCGLGARDTLRLEAAMPLYSHELSETINPLEAGLDRIICWDNDFIGKQSLLEIKDKPQRKLIAFECLEGIARTGADVFSSDRKIGYVTSGTFSPTLKKAIGLALVEASFNFGEFEISVREAFRKAKIVPKPFYKRKNSIAY
ncbi:MAG: glycine cleavage system aminomethyltransferase GcvT, partial [Elusimicrobia bacterium]|nr:glycine cleavage system aminomethyltransferase GcvT [Elusimicrobiota bacterium]